MRAAGCVTWPSDVGPVHIRVVAVSFGDPAHQSRRSKRSYRHAFFCVHSNPNSLFTAFFSLKDPHSLSTCFIRRHVFHLLHSFAPVSRASSLNSRHMAWQWRGQLPHSICFFPILRRSMLRGRSSVQTCHRVFSPNSTRRQRGADAS